MTKSTFPLRLPSDVKAWMKRQAELNCSSQNSEVIRAIRERMERQQEAGLEGAGMNAQIVQHLRTIYQADE